MTAVFEQSGLRFEYPENWSIDSEEQLDEKSEVMVTSPGGAFWSVSLYPAGTELRPILDLALEGIKAEYSDLDAEWIEKQVGDWKLAGYDASFFCLDLTNTAQILGFQDNRATYLLLSQAEDRDFAVLDQVFLAMTTSLLRSLSA